LDEHEKYCPAIVEKENETVNFFVNKLIFFFFTGSCLGRWRRQSGKLHGVWQRSAILKEAHEIGASRTYGRRRSYHDAAG
jgi:hypothetical protein